MQIIQSILVDVLRIRLTSEYGMVSLRPFDSQIKINANNIYHTWIDIMGSNSLMLTGVLSNSEYEYLSRNPGCLQEDRIKLIRIQGEKGAYDLVQGTGLNFQAQIFYH